MAKRIVTKIGDVFCAEIDGKFKCYFQYIDKDSSCLYSSVIRAFKTRYPLDYIPDIDKIVEDEILFYGHVFLRLGIEGGEWYKVGKSKNLGLEEAKKIIFGLAQDTYIDMRTNKVHFINPLDGWKLWHINEPVVFVGKLPKQYWDIVQPGAVYPVMIILSRLKYGYYIHSRDDYDVIKRVPREDVDSYTKLEKDGITHYFHFYGADAVQEIVTHGDEVICRLDTEHHRCGDQELRKAKFWDTNWLYYDFISQEEFEAMWNKPK